MRRLISALADVVASKLPVGPRYLNTHVSTKKKWHAQKECEIDSRRSNMTWKFVLKIEPLEKQREGVKVRGGRINFTLR